MSRLALALSIAVAGCAGLFERDAAAQASTTAAGGPVLTMATEKGAIQIRLFQSESPKSVEHVLGLVKRNFYRALRIHRVEASLIQFGDPQSKDMSMREWWGRRSAGAVIGVAEFNKHTHVRGAVSLAHGGDAKGADSQLFIMKTASPSLNGKHVVIGQVTSGMAVVDALKVADQIKNLTITEAAQK
jgi:cyclophilin family peptidyl-prolyl cis-trans isomerase